MQSRLRKLLKKRKKKESIPVELTERRYFEAGKAWKRRDAMGRIFFSGYFSPQGFVFAARKFKAQNGRQLNFLIQENKYKKTTPEQPPYLVFIPYRAKKEE